MPRQQLRRYIPSMFHRRLLLLLAAGILVCLAIGAKTARLTLGPSHDGHRQAAEQALQSEDLIATVRGRIVDRQGRVLAEDEPTWAVAVNYNLIAGSWAYDRARAAAREQAGRRWYEMTPHQQQQLIDRHQPRFDQEVGRLWQTLVALRQQHEPDYNRQKLEQRKGAIRDRVQNVANHLWSIWQKRRRQQLQKEVSLSEVAEPIQEQTRAHVVLREISPATRSVIQSRIAEAEGDPENVWSQVELRRPKGRQYPFETLTLSVDRSHLPTPLRDDEPVKVETRGVGVHLLGQMRDLWKSDFDRPSVQRFKREDESGATVVDLSGYLPGDRIGSFGLERAYEAHLRGKRGRLIHQLDTGRSKRIPPEPGDDLKLTLDVKLQARIQAIMSPATGLMEVQPWHLDDPDGSQRLGQPLNGAAVVLDSENNDVLAAVSVPPMPLETLRKHPEQIYESPRRLPYVNRPIARHYPPGSTIKPMMMNSAAAAGEYDITSRITCDGHLLPDRDNVYRCWIYKRYESTHGPLTAAESIERSCNVFYYKLGQRMGLPQTIDWYQRFGLGSDSSIALPAESPGRLPDPDQRPSPADDAINMAIGQGPVTWTPIQAASAYATLLRDGARLDPTFVEPSQRRQSRETRRLPLNPKAIDEALEGLHMVVHGDEGTGRYLQLGDPEPIFNVDGVDIYGKSGTADPGSRWIDKDLDNELDAGEIERDPADHAWFVAMPRAENEEKPRYVVAVVVEYAGSGSQVAGPVANQIVHALKTEDYLP